MTVFRILIACRFGIFRRGSIAWTTVVCRDGILRIRIPVAFRIVQSAVFGQGLKGDTDSRHIICPVAFTAIGHAFKALFIQHALIMAVGTGFALLACKSICAKLAERASGLRAIEGLFMAMRDGRAGITALSVVTRFAAGANAVFGVVAGHGARSTIIDRLTGIAALTVVTGFAAHADRFKDGLDLKPMFDAMLDFCYRIAVLPKISLIAAGANGVSAIGAGHGAWFAMGYGVAGIAALTVVAGFAAHAFCIARVRTRADHFAMYRRG